LFCKDLCSILIKMGILERISEIENEVNILYHTISRFNKIFLYNLKGFGYLPHVSV